MSNNRAFPTFAHTSFWCYFSTQLFSQHKSFLHWTLEDTITHHTIRVIWFLHNRMVKYWLKPRMSHFAGYSMSRNHSHCITNQLISLSMLFQTWVWALRTDQLFENIKLLIHRVYCCYKLTNTMVIILFDSFQLSYLVKGTIDSNGYVVIMTTQSVPHFLISTIRPGRDITYFVKSRSILTG